MRGPALLLTHTDNMGRAMSFLIYFAVLLFTAASALFGLDLMTSPLPAARHHHPRPQVADNATPAKADTAPAQKQAGKSTNALASRDDDKTKSDRALSPVYPTSPGVAKSEVRTVYPPSNSVLGAVVAQQNEAAAAKQQPTAPQTAGSAPVNDSAKQANASEASPAAAQPVAQKAPASCNVQACAGAYQSFRASDCTYQPFSGERRVCTKPIGGAQHAASQPRQEQGQEQEQHQARRTENGDAGLRDTVRRVKAMRPQQNDAYDDDDYDDAPVVAGRGRRIFMLPPRDSDNDSYYR